VRIIEELVEIWPNEVCDSCIEGWFPSMLKAVSLGQAVVWSIFGFMMDNSFKQ